VHANDSERDCAQEDDQRKPRPPGSRKGAVGKSHRLLSLGTATPGRQPGTLILPL